MTRFYAKIIYYIRYYNFDFIFKNSYQSDKNVIFYDLLNHGKSKKGFKQLKFEDFNNQLIQLIRHLDKKKFNLIGFSLGALIAQYFTAKYYNNINKLILIASVYDRNKEEKEKVEKRYKKSLKDQSIIDNSINRWFNQDYLISKAQTGHILYETRTKQQKYELDLKKCKPFTPYHLEKCKRFIHIASYYLPIKPINNKILISSERFIELKNGFSFREKYPAVNRFSLFSNDSCISL